MWNDFFYLREAGKRNLGINESVKDRAARGPARNYRRYTGLSKFFEIAITVIS